MAKTYYAVDLLRPGYPVWFMDPVTADVKLDEATHLSVAAACEEFERAHGGAVFLSEDAWDKRLTRLMREKALLASWTGRKS